MEDSVLIKVKYGDVLRRFNAPIADGKFSVNMNGLREKIISLFSLAPDTDMMLTYLDEDDDVITLVDDDDLQDVVNQGLYPVRVTVNVNNDTNGKQTYSKVSSTPPVQPLPNLPDLSAGLSEALKNVPEPLRGVLKKVSEELASNSPLSSDIADYLSKVGLSFLGHLSDSGPVSNVQNDVPVKNSECSNGKLHVTSYPPLVSVNAEKASEFGTPLENDSENFCHWGIGCDGCGIVPIVGPRFKSKVKVDYDLCVDCHSKIGNDNDYVRIDRPAIARHHLPHLRARDRGAIPRVLRGLKVEPSVEKLESRFIQDVNIFDGVVMEPLTPFTKIWRMRNNGTLAWPKKTKLVWIGGDQLTDAESIEVQIPDAGLQVDQELDISIDFISPKHSGRYISYWRMASPSGQKFGQRVWVIIQVEAPAIEEESPSETVRNLNLNLPPPPPPVYKLPPPPPPPPPRRTPIVNKTESVELREKSPMEDKLLGELKEMGFGQVDLNKQVLRMNEYDLDQAVDDLCGVSEWDPILEELEEMGFHNTEMNKKLLTKNNGSIKRVVMDLIAGEEEV